MSERRVMRGGSYYDGTWIQRLAVRNWSVPENRFRSSGLRLVIRRKR
jgi:formylglycine-generating enzyme required for sulfatase activity